MSKNQQKDASKGFLIKELAYVRSGDKGDISNVGIMAFNNENYEIIKKQVTAQKVKAHYGELVKGDVKVYEMPNINSLQVVMYKALGGGATCTLRFDETGKAMCMGMLFMAVEVPDNFKPARPPM
jgi:hypothetical protein